MNQLGIPFDHLMKYWFHFAIMFEALFILTTIDTGTRIARFLLQEMFGYIHPKLGKTDWLPGSILSTFIITVSWGMLVATGSIGTIWPMFGIANQLLAVLALALVTTVMVNSGRGAYIPFTLIPMLFVSATTLTAGATMMSAWFQTLSKEGQFVDLFPVALRFGMTLFVMTSVIFLVIWAACRWITILTGLGKISSDSDSLIP